MREMVAKEARKVEREQAAREKRKKLEEVCDPVTSVAKLMFLMLQKAAAKTAKMAKK